MRVFHLSDDHECIVVQTEPAGCAVKALVFSFFRAIGSQCRPRMLLLTLLPFIVATGLWFFLLWLGIQPLIDVIQEYFVANNIHAASGKWLTFVGLAAFKTFIVPLIAMWLLLPLMVATALIFVSVIAMPALVRFVGTRYHPQLERRHGGNFLTVLWITVKSLFIFVVLWIVTLPLSSLPLLGIAVQPLLWGWLTCKLVASEVFALYADPHEQDELMRRHRWSLLTIGTLCGLLGMVPGLLWMCGALAALFFPILIPLSIWLYVLVFTFSGLWFSHFGLTAIAALRQGRTLEAEVAVEEVVVVEEK
jgi:hypothetical protein